MDLDKENLILTNIINFNHFLKKTCTLIAYPDQIIYLRKLKKMNISDENQFKHSFKFAKYHAKCS